jgi:hypothetical protein
VSGLPKDGPAGHQLELVVVQQKDCFVHGIPMDATCQI